LSAKDYFPQAALDIFLTFPIFLGVFHDLNCHRARQLISPYLDQQLTGREMLALQEHFSLCETCEAERRSIRQVKLLLRSLHSPRPQADLQGRILVRLTEAEQPLWRVLVLTTPRPQRGRRLMTALAISCLTVLSFAVSLAPDSRDGALTTSGFLLPMGFLPARSPLADNTNLVSWTNEPQNDLLIVNNDAALHQARFYSGQYLSLPSSDLRLSAMPDAAPRSIPNSMDFAVYRSR
jgi:hypothetical protein